MTDDQIKLVQEEARAALRASRAQEVADRLVGTCRMLNEVCSQEEIDDPEFMSDLMLLCFECDCCGWWASTDELNNEPDQEYDELCDECYDGEL